MEFIVEHTKLNALLWLMSGVLIQSVLMTWRSRDWTNLLICVGIGAFGMIPGKQERHYILNTHLIFATVVFAFAVAYRFRRQLLPRIHEGAVLSYTMLFWGAHFIYFASAHARGPMRLFAIVFTLPTLCVLVMTLPKTRHRLFTKLFLYCWYLLVLALLAAMQIASHPLFAGDRYFTAYGTLGPLDHVMTGMVFCYALVNALYILALIPVPVTKRQTMEQRMKQVRELADLMVERFNETQLTYRQALGAVAGQGTLLVANYAMMGAAHHSITNVMILLPMIYFQLRPGLVTEGKRGQL